MKLFCLIFFFIIDAGVSSGQRIKGRIVDEEHATALSGVTVQNLRNNSRPGFSDEKGYYEIDATKGDSISFTLLGFAPQIVTYNGENEGWFSWITLKQVSYVIDTVVIGKGLTKYQKDSLEKREIYGKKVDYRPAKPQLPKLKELEAGKPFVIKAPISGFIEKRQKRYKRLKAFQERYAATETQNFIDSRYSDSLVATLTPLKDDSLAIFMRTYPMPYAFARAASDLEIKMWIRHNYREWLQLQAAKKP